MRLSHKGGDWRVKCVIIYISALFRAVGSMSNSHQRRLNSTYGVIHHYCQLHNNERKTNETARSSIMWLAVVMYGAVEFNFRTVLFFSSFGNNKRVTCQASHSVTNFSHFTAGSATWRIPSTNLEIEYKFTIVVIKTAGQVFFKAQCLVYKSHS